MFHINPRTQVISPSLVERYRSIEPAALGHHIDGGVMDNGIKPIRPGTSIAGIAVTVQTFGRDSTACHKAIDFIQPGDVLVIDRGGDMRYACWGEMTSLAAQVRGAAGVVVDGPITDITTLREMDLPVFCRGAAVITTQLLGQCGAVNVPVNCGGVVVHPGDLIVGDDNGIIVIRPDQAEEWLHIAVREEAEEVAYRQALLQGQLPSQLAPIDELIRNAEKGYALP